jgi:hypothetical protein
MSKFSQLSLDDLMARFAENGLAQSKAELQGKISKYNKLFDEMAAIDKELRVRGTEARLRLREFFTHQNMHVRLQAAKLSLGVAPVEARKLIEEIAESGHFPEAGSAGMCIWALEQGIFKPD